MSLSLERLKTPGSGLTVRISVLTIIGVDVASVVSTIQERRIVINFLTFMMLIFQSQFVMVADV